MSESKSIPYGYCQCGCGEKAPIAKKTRNPIGHKKGEPIRFIRGHQARCTDREALFWEKVNRLNLNDCWEWTAGLSTTGYGVFSEAGRSVYAHRYSYELNVGPIPEGLVIDHLCRNRKCVNPRHLEVVTNQENCRRGLKGEVMKTHCIRGHKFTDENTYITGRGHRQCRACTRLRAENGDC